MATKTTGILYELADGRRGIAYRHQQKVLKNSNKDVLLKMVDKDMKPVMSANNPTMQATCFQIKGHLKVVGYVD